MTYLRRSIALLVVYLAVFFNIERLDFKDQNDINLRSFVYVLATIAILANLLIPLFRQQRLLTNLSLWGISYLIIRFGFFFSIPLSDTEIYLTLTELVFVIVGAWISRHVALDLYDFEQAVITMTLPQANRQVRRLRDSSHEVQTEMLRSRRYRRPLSVLVVRPHPNSLVSAIHRSVQEVQKTMMTRYVVTSVTRVVADLMRRTDMIFEQPSANQFIVLSPETSGPNSEAFIARIKAAAMEKLGIEVMCSSASFPDDALTFEELIHEAETRINDQTPTLSVPIELDEKQAVSYAESKH